MAEPRRPVFAEGQVLAAADLTQVVDHARNVDARHARYLHTSGIAFGLEIVSTDVSIPQPGGVSKPAKDVTLKSGLFVNGHGQQIVVPDDRAVSTALLNGVTLQHDATQADPNWSYLHPLFLQAEELPDPPASSLLGCSSNEVTRIVEGCQLALGSRGDHLTLGDQRPATPGEELADSLPPWRVLLGFVRADMALQRFVEVTKTLDGIGPRYAGVRASTVAGHGGSIELRPADNDTSRAGKLVVGEDKLVYGPVGQSGDVTPVFSVSLSGNLTVNGLVHNRLGVGVRALSGVATHGTIIPLPSGVTEEDVDVKKGGSLDVHIMVSPRLPPVDPTNVVAPPVVYQCSVDAQRRVTCLVAPSSGGGLVLGSANYLLLTTPTPKE